MMALLSPRVLFLTTANPAEIKAEWPYYQNWTLPKVIEEHRADVSVRSWQEPGLDSHALAKYDVITFLWCNDYHKHGPEFCAFVRNSLIPAQEHNPTLRIANDSQVILWNLDKQTYLPELQNAGFLIPATEILEGLSGPAAHSALFRTVQAHQNNPIVLKPSVSGSSKGTYCIREPSRLSIEDVAYLESVIKDGTDGSLLIQRYEPAIERGEYSLVFINKNHTHTILKTPRRGEFRCQGEFGGGTAEISLTNVPEDAVRVANRALAYMQSRFGGTVSSTSSPTRKTHRRSISSKIKEMLASHQAAPKPSTETSPNPIVYARIDGVVREDGKFVLMEIEAIEPHLWLETALTPGCKEALYSALLGKEVLRATRQRFELDGPADEIESSAFVSSVSKEPTVAVVPAAVEMAAPPQNGGIEKPRTTTVVDVKELSVDAVV